MTDGTLERRDEHQVIRFERRIGHPVERVWRALTDPDEIAAWLALSELDLEEGGRVVLRWQNTDDEGNTAVARGTVSALEPPRLLEFDTDIHGRLRWELEPVEDGTALTFAGWHIHLDHLVVVLDGGTFDWENWTRDHRPDWERVHEHYTDAD